MIIEILSPVLDPTFTFASVYDRLAEIKIFDSGNLKTIRKPWSQSGIRRNIPMFVNFIFMSKTCQCGEIFFLSIFEVIAMPFFAIGNGRVYHLTIKFVMFWTSLSFPRAIHWWNIYWNDTFFCNWWRRIMFSRYVTKVISWHFR